MPQGKGTYGSKVGRPKKSLLTGSQKTLPEGLKKRIMAAKERRKRMPKGQSPNDRINARYSLLSKQLESMPEDYSMVTKLRRKVKEFLGTSDGQMVTSMKRENLLKKVKKLESAASEKFRSQMNISEEQDGG